MAGSLIEVHLRYPYGDVRGLQQAQANISQIGKKKPEVRKIDDL